MYAILTGVVISDAIATGLTLVAERCRMPISKDTFSVPGNYIRREGSERRPSSNATLVGPADPTEAFSVTIVLRRRPDGPVLPDHAFFLATPPRQRPRMSQDEFAAKYGASADDVAKVTAFVEAQGMKVIETHLARRTVVVSGTVANMSQAFGVTLGRYQREVAGRRGGKPQTETYRGRDGFIYVPKDLGEVLVGVFGLDNRRITKRNSGDPPNTGMLTVPTIRQLYDFPLNSAAGQTIGILSLNGYQRNDIQDYFSTLPADYQMGKLTDVPVNSENNGIGDPETTQDICVAASAAPKADIAVYFTTDDQQGWAALMQHVVSPDAFEPKCSVLSVSFYLSDGDDPATLMTNGVTQDGIDMLTSYFQDAALQGITICVASGDYGTDSKVGDKKAHVQYPASDPLVLAVGGTTVGNQSEYIWNDTFPTATGAAATGATGGGVSDLFPRPTYQDGAGIPASLNDGHVGRGVPDVAANASPNSGYPIPLQTAPSIHLPNPFSSSGTSAAAPLWAGLIAVINAALGQRVGFVNPALYAIGSPGFRDIVGAPGPADNGLNGVPGYPASIGWDACTGWGSPPRQNPFGCSASHLQPFLLHC